MIDYLIPAHAAAEIKEHGLAEAAKSFGMTEKELLLFQDMHGTKSFDAVQTHGLFGPRKPGPRRRDPNEIQDAIDRYGKQGAAQKLGITLGTLYGYISRLKLKTDGRGSVPPKEELDSLLSRYTQAEVADVYGVNTLTVSRWARNYGIKSKRARQMEHRKLVAKLHETMSLKEISELTGIPINEL